MNCRHPRVYVKLSGLSNIHAIFPGVFLPNLFPHHTDGGLYECVLLLREEDGPEEEKREDVARKTAAHTHNYNTSVVATFPLPKIACAKRVPIITPPPFPNIELSLIPNIGTEVHFATSSTDGRD